MAAAQTRQRRQPVACSCCTAGACIAVTERARQLQSPWAPLTSRLQVQQVANTSRRLPGVRWCSPAATSCIHEERGSTSKWTEPPRPQHSRHACRRALPSQGSCCTSRNCDRFNCPPSQGRGESRRSREPCRAACWRVGPPSAAAGSSGARLTVGQSSRSGRWAAGGRRDVEQPLPLLSSPPGKPQRNHHSRHLPVMLCEWWGGQGRRPASPPAPARALPPTTRPAFHSCLQAPGRDGAAGQRR